jgi:plasmid maintenance system killer protein
MVIDYDLLRAYANPESTRPLSTSFCKLDYVDLVSSINDLRVPPGNRLHALEGNRKGQYSISIND